MGMESAKRVLNRYGETFAAFYDRYFGHYAEKAAPFFLCFLASRASPFARAVLDLGCGTGRIAFHFLQAGYDFTGLDSSPAMLALARDRCLRFLPAGRARFLQTDISSFGLEGPFGFALSTYNTLNHLDSEEKLRSCFRSVRRCLAPGGLLMFDYHTAKGLREWASTETASLEEGTLTLRGAFNPRTRRAVSSLRGVFRGRPFAERILNWSLPLERLEGVLGEEGFSKVVFARIDDLNRPLADPEGEKRVVALAG